MGVLPTFGLDSWKGYILPVITLGGYSVSYLARQMRSSLLEVMGQDYIRTARAKGLSESKVIIRHALRNALIPVITVLGPTIANLLTGSFVVEQIFAIPGVGQLYIKSINLFDYDVFMVDSIFYTFIGLLAGILVDISYGFIDPRIRMGSKK
jgi:oligopeptide transport system permease protein